MLNSITIVQRYSSLSLLIPQHHRSTVNKSCTTNINRFFFLFPGSTYQINYYNATRLIPSLAPEQHSFPSHRGIISSWNGLAINYPAACMRAMHRSNSHRRRPASVNRSAKVIIASQRAARRNTWPLIIEMSAYLARRWNRVSRVAVSAYTVPRTAGLLDRVGKNRPGKWPIRVSSWGRNGSLCSWINGLALWEFGITGNYTRLIARVDRFLVACGLME